MADDAHTGLSTGAATAIGIGVGSALVPVVGPAGLALGLAAFLVPVAVARLRGRP